MVRVNALNNLPIVQMNVVRITSSQTYNVPDNLVNAVVEMVGGGSSGGAGSSNTASISRTGGVPGVSGEWALGFFTKAQLGTSISVTIGAGGAGTNANLFNNAGGTTSLGGLMTATGGSASPLALQPDVPISYPSASPGTGGIFRQIGSANAAWGLWGGYTGDPNGNQLVQSRILTLPFPETYIDGPAPSAPANSGLGGGTGMIDTSPIAPSATRVAGGNGGSGYVQITEFLRSS